MTLTPEELVPAAELKAYLMDPMPYDWGKMLTPFTPPLPREGKVLMASFFGDAFTEDNAGEIWWVNGMEGRVDRIARDRESFFQRITDDHLVMLKTKLLESLIVANKLVKVGMVYGLITPRSQGGQYHVDNVGAAPIADAFAYMGDQFRRANPRAPAAASAKGPAVATQPPLEMPKLDPKGSKKKGWFN